MAKVLIIANFELSYETSKTPEAAEVAIRAKEKRILDLLRKLTAEDGSGGTVESFEIEGFTRDEDGGSPSGYYYNKHSPDESPKPGDS